MQYAWCLPVPGVPTRYGTWGFLSDWHGGDKTDTQMASPHGESWSVASDYIWRSGHEMPCYKNDSVCWWIHFVPRRAWLGRVLERAGGTDEVGARHGERHDAEPPHSVKQGSHLVWAPTTTSLFQLYCNYLVHQYHLPQLPPWPLSLLKLHSAYFRRKLCKISHSTN